MQAFLFYVDDWLSSKHIEMMDAAEERGYLRLLLRCAKEEDCGIPHDAAQLSIMSMLGPQWWKQTADKSRRIGEMTSGDKLLRCFDSMDGRLYNSRLLKEFGNQKRIREERRIAGLKGGRPKANDNQLVSNSLANENQLGKQKESKEKQAQALSPALPEGKEIHCVASPKAGAVDVWFETDFWPKWLRRPDDDLPGPALKAARSVAKTVAIRKQIMAAVEACRADRQEKEPGYRVSARRWLREGMWEASAVESAKPQELWPGQLGGRPHPDAIIRNFKKGDFIR
jgi:hypothetical protein